MTSSATLCIQRPDRPATSAPLSIPPTILIVEDEPLLLELATLLLAEQGYEILQARSARQALQVVSEREEPPSLFLLDHDLGPGMTGLELFDQLRAQPGYAEVPAIMLSCLLPPGEELERRAMTGIPKPYEIDQLVDSVVAAITAHSKTLV